MLWLIVALMPLFIPPVNAQIGGNTAGATALVSSGTLTLAGGNNITLSQAGNAVTISAGAGGGGLSAGMSTAGNTAGTTGLVSNQLVLVGSNNITLSQSVNGQSATLSILGGAGGAAGTNTLGISNLGNTSGTSGVISGSALQFVLAGGNNITLSQSINGSSATVTISAFNQSSQSAIKAFGATNTGNTAGNTGVSTGVDWVIAGTNNITVSESTVAGGPNTLWLSAPSGGAGATNSNFFEPFYFYENTATSIGSLSQLGLQPFSLPVNLTFGQINFVVSASVPADTVPNTFSIRFTNSTQSLSYSAVYTVTKSNFVDLFLFSRGSGVFSSELETFKSTRNSLVTFHHATYRASVSFTGVSGGNLSLAQQVSVSISYPAMTSSTATSINAVSSYTAWSPGYTFWTSTASMSASRTFQTSTAASTTLGSTYPATTVWSVHKMIPLNYATSLTPGEYWLGIIRASSTSSSSTFDSTIIGAPGTGASYSATYDVSAITSNTAQLSWGGATHTIASSLAWLGQQSQATMAAAPGLGTFSGTWASNTTYLNNLGNPAGAVAFSQINTGTSFFRSWFQMASNRI